MSARARILVAALELDFQYAEQARAAQHDRMMVKLHRARTPRQLRRARKQFHRVAA